MRQTHIFGIILALAPVMLSAQEQPVEATEPTAATPAVQEPAPAPQEAAAEAPAIQLPTCTSDDSALESQLAGLKKQAEAGDPMAAKKIYTQYALKGCFDQAHAWSDFYLKLMQAKAEGGDVDTMFDLGIMCLRGEDYVTQSVQDGVKWLYRAMEAGHAGASFILGDVFTRQGDKAAGKDAYAKAFAAYGKLAEGGDAAALYWQGVMLVGGLGVEKDIPAGIAKLEKAAEQGSAIAMERLGGLFAAGATGKVDMERAIHYARMCADKTGDGRMAYATACAYLQGQGVQKDEAMGEKYLEMAASANYPEAIYFKGFRLKTAGKAEEAYPYFNQGASMGIVPCMTEAGLHLLYGRGGEPQDEARGLALLERAADSWNYCQSDIERSGSATAAYELARYYDDKDEPELADTWYVVASSHGMPEAFAKRGLMHLNPFSKVTWDPTTAYGWWKSGSKAGDETCTLYLNIFYFAVIPVLVIIAFGGPALYVHRLNKRKRLEKAEADRKAFEET